MMVFRIIIFAFASAGLFAILWLLFGRLLVKCANVEDKKLNTWDAQHHLALEIRRAELHAKKKALQDAQKRLGMAEEAATITEDLAQTEMKLEKTEKRIEQLDRFRDQNINLGEKE